MSATATEISAACLAELRRLAGADGVISHADELLVYECDAFTMEKNLPNAVVLPRTTEQEIGRAHV